MLYGRELLLYGEKRNAVLELPEIQRFGIDSYGDANYVSIYGLQPAEWYARGIRLLGRTAVECTRDNLASAIGRDVAALAFNAANALVLDPFAGSLHTRRCHQVVARFTEGFNRFVTSTVAPVASGWSISPGGICAHWESAAFPRRTPHPVIRSNPSIFTKADARQAPQSTRARLGIIATQRLPKSGSRPTCSGLMLATDAQEYPSARTAHEGN